MSMTIDAATVELNEKLAEVDDLITGMMKVGAKLAHERGLDEPQTAALFAHMISEQLDETDSPANTLLPLFIGRLLTTMIMSTSAMMMATEALEHLRKRNDA